MQHDKKGGRAMFVYLSQSGAELEITGAVACTPCECPDEVIFVSAEGEPIIKGPRWVFALYSVNRVALEAAVSPAEEC